MVSRRGRESEPLNGPGKLTQALAIDLSHNGIDLFSADSPVRLTPGGAPPAMIRATPRIGISKAVEHPWRFVSAPYEGPSGQNVASTNPPLTFRSDGNLPGPKTPSGRTDTVRPADELAPRLAEGKKLRVKFGLDPTAPAVTLGWAVVLRKLRDSRNWATRRC